MDILKILKDRHFWAFFGSGLIVSVAYMDPGNWGTSISGGANFKYDLLWVVWLASGMAMLFQYLSGKMGLAEISLAEVIKKKWKNKKLVFVYWLLAELAVLATDLAEFLGIVVALNLLFGIPMLLGTFIAVLDVVLILILTQKSFRTLEYAFFFFVGIIGISYLYELIITQPEISEVLVASVTPKLNKDLIAIAVGIIGATVMPHALFVHSWLLKNKKNNTKTNLKYHIIENVSSLFLAGLINAAILIMAASAFYGKEAVVSIEQAYETLTPLYGPLASIVFGVALLSAGISSSITGMLAGQSIMEALTDFKFPVWLRRIITRIVNAIPLLIAVLLNIEPLDILVYSQIVLSLMIPLPLLPLIYYTSKKEIMGNLVNEKWVTYLAYVFAAIILILNAYLLYTEIF